MSDIMTQGVIRMPFELAMADELSRRQFYDRARQLLSELHDAQSELARLREQQPIAYRVDYPEGSGVHGRDRFFGADDKDRMERHAKYDADIVSLYAEPRPAKVSVPVELSAVNETVRRWGGWWKPCSGCHETNEGHSTGPFSAVLQCNLGNGCSECGGIGAIYEHYDDHDNMRASGPQAATTEDSSAVVGTPALPPWWPKFIKFVSELTDRDSPENEPEAMVATAADLERAALCAIETHNESAPSTSTVKESLTPDAAALRRDAEIAGLTASVANLSRLFDEQRALLVEVEDVCGRDGHGGPLEDGESEIIDRVRAHLAATNGPALAAEKREGS